MKKGQKITHRHHKTGNPATEEHNAVWRKILQPGGVASLTAQDCLVLSTDPELPAEQRDAFARLAQERA